MLRLSEFLPYRLSVASNAVSERVAGVYQTRFGLKVPEWRVIAVVAEQGRLTQAGLVAATQMDKMTVSRAVTALVERGLLTRAPAGDRRTLELALTDEGNALHIAADVLGTVGRHMGEAERFEEVGHCLRIGAGEFHELEAVEAHEILVTLRLRRARSRSCHATLPKC